MPRDKLLHLVDIKSLRPTQMTVGYHEVAQKRRNWADMKDEKRTSYLARHMVPALLGPGDVYYVVDHHHLIRALHDEGCDQVQVTMIKNLSQLHKDEFWVFADHHGWCHPYDAHGDRVEFGDIPKHIGDLTDDPFRSLAGAARRGGGFAKDSTPFSEFLWADFFRRRMKAKALKADFAGAVVSAITLAKSLEAKYMPGWCGASPDD